MDDNTIEEKRSVFGEIEEIEDEVEKNFKHFKNFEIHQVAPYNHHFYFNHNPILAYRRSKLAKIIEKEWEILEQNLPSTIFVRAYKGRFDLMRVAITGLEGTPYCHGLFFFDILFPINYPSKPPEIFHHSPNDCLKLNPNLYRKQCGNILELLLSIQGQVLNTNYVLKSKRKNREIFWRNCLSMIHSLQCPPDEFEVLVRGHFRKAAHSVLVIYKAQMNDVIASKDNNVNDMKQLFFFLVKIFEGNGAYCRHHCDKALVKALEEDECPEFEFPEQKGQDNWAAVLKFTTNVIRNILF